MKRRTLLAVTIAVLLGLGVVTASRYTDIFKTPPPPAPPEEPRVLVAALNLFEGMAIMPGDVRVRPIRPEERAFYDANKDKLLPPLVGAGALRILARPVPADKPILETDLEPQRAPNPLNRRLGPGMVGVQVAVPAERAAGGLIQTGERVDVYLTTNICTNGKCDNAVTQTAAIARNLKVIVKRNTLWHANAPVPADKPINFTLEANPYRAALITFAQTKGDLSLVPTSASRKAPDDQEFANDDERVAAVKKGELSVGDADLERIFKMQFRRPRQPQFDVPGPAAIPAELPRRLLPW
jgi:Flp pilus assembly protein CpaB